MVVLYVLGAIVVINCAYYLLFAKFSYSSFKGSKTPSENIPISLIVCAKNEAENLSRHIPLWLDQEYPDFEIILINDASLDETLEVMAAYAEKEPRIKIVNVKNNEAFWGNKKYALTLGIKRAKNNHLVFTDADCYPASKNWLASMASQFHGGKQIVLGYGAYEKRPGFLNKLIRFETLMTAVQYFSYAKAGIPYMGVGRNLGYTSDLYYENNGFIKHIKLASGDDDLFVNETATSENTAICIDPEAFTYSIPKTGRKRWFLQKKRHYTTVKFYKPLHKFLLGSYYISNLAFWLTGIIALSTTWWQIAVAMIVFRFLVQYIVMAKAATKLREKDLVFLIPFLELGLIFSQMSIFISKSDEKNSQWK